MKINKTINQFIKFGIVGLINTVLSYVITNLGYYFFHIHEQICNIVAFSITVFISFILNNKFVFIQDKENRNFWKTFIKVYVSYSITGIVLTAILLFIEEQKLGIPHYYATMINLIITVPLNFVLNKLWAYKNRF